MKQTIKNYLKIGILLLGIAFFFANCQNESNDLEPENKILRKSKIKTVSFEDAKKFFNSNKNKNSKLFSKGNNELKLTPQWETLNQTALYKIEDAKLTLAKVRVNRKGNYTSELFFLNINDDIKNVIFTIWPKNVSQNGTIIDATIYLNEISGQFIDGYVIEKGKFVKRIVKTNRHKTQKASFLSFFQVEDEASDCWNTDGGGFTFDTVYLYETNNNYQGSDNTYSIITSWNNSSSSDHQSSISSSSGGGGSYSSVAASLYIDYIETVEIYEDDDLTEEDIIVNITNECQKEILIEGIDNCSPLSSLIIDIFGGGYDINYIIESSDLGPNISASTSNIVKYNSLTKKCYIKTTVDKNYLKNATDLSIARTIIHESFHATLTFMVVEGKFIYNGSPDSSFANVMNGYINYLETNNNDQYEGAQHEILLELVSEITTALKNYGVQNGYNLSNNFYSDLSWGGLTHLKDSSGNIITNPLFVSAVPNANDRARIINTIAAEVTNSNQGSITPKGKPCD